MSAKTRIPLPHPGETLDCLKPLNMSVNALAKELKVTPARLNEIVAANAASPRIRRSGSRAILGPARGFG